jgi:hypothetical protein
MSPGAICVLQEYNDNLITPLVEEHCRPGVKAAADEFFSDKPENVSILYAGNFRIFAHGYFRKI